MISYLQQFAIRAWYSAYYIHFLKFKIAFKWHARSLHNWDSQQVFKTVWYWRNSTIFKEYFESVRNSCSKSKFCLHFVAEKLPFISLFCTWQSFFVQNQYFWMKTGVARSTSNIFPECTSKTFIPDVRFNLPLRFLNVSLSGGSWWKWLGGLRNFIFAWTYRIVRWLFL